MNFFEIMGTALDRLLADVLPLLPKMSMIGLIIGVILLACHVRRWSSSLIVGSLVLVIVYCLNYGIFEYISYLFSW